MSTPTAAETPVAAGRVHQPFERGSMTVELVVITPVLLVIGITVLIFGRVTQSRQQVVEAARAGAEAAAVLPNPDVAQWGSSVDAAVGVVDPARTCLRQQVVTDVGHFYPGGFVTVTVTCTVALSDLSVPGMPGSTTVSATASAPIDPFRSVG